MYIYIVRGIANTQTMHHWYFLCVNTNQRGWLDIDKWCIYLDIANIRT